MALLVLCLMFLLPGANSAARDPARPIKQMRHATWNETSGISGIVNALSQSTDGFLWVGSTTGLYRFDGLKFEPFFPPTSDHPLLDARTLLATRDGGLWVGHRNGVAFLKQDGATFYTEREGLPYGRVHALVQTQDGAIWAAAAGGLARFFDSHWEKIQVGWTYPARSADALLVDRWGTLWVTGGGSVYLLPRGGRTFESTGAKVSSWTEVCAGPDGSAWIADPVAHKLLNFKRYPESGYLTITANPLQDINDIRFDTSGSLWLATGRGLYRIPPSSISSLHKATDQHTEQDSFFLADGLSGREAKVVFEDRENNIWVGTATGLDRFSSRSATQTNIGHTPTILIPGRHTELWASPFGASPFLIPLHDCKPYRVSNWWTTSFYIDASDTLWVSMQSQTGWEKNRGLWKDENGRLSKVTPPADIPQPDIQAITGDTRGRLWMIVSGHGEYTLQHGKWERVTLFAGGDSEVSPDTQFVDSFGRVWLLYYARNIVALVDGSKRILFTPEQRMDLGNPIIGGALGPQVWISGTKGLGFFDGTTFSNIQASDGFHFAGATAVLPTDHDGLWLKAPEGVLQIPQAEVSAFLHDHAHAVRYQTFDGSTDFVAPLTRFGSTGTDVARTGDGKLWFASLGGVAMIDPAHLAKNTTVPPVFIRSLTANGKIYPAYQELILPKATREVALDYTSLSLTLSERNQFRYQLTGVDTEWKDAGTRHQAFYTNLQPGVYTFHVIASNNDGAWNDRGAALTFRILPMFFQTAWFRTLAVLVFAALLWTLFLIRLHYMNKATEKRLRDRMSERERIARDLHDTLLQGFQMLLLRFQVITDTLPPGDPATSLLEESLAHSERALKEGRDRVSALRAETEPGEDLAIEIKRFGEDLSSTYQTAFRFSVEGTPTALQTVIHEEVRMIAREAMANAFQHAHATSVESRLIFAPRNFCFLCSDDGCGIPAHVWAKKEKRDHWGLLGMQERAKKIGGELHIVSNAPKGTKVELKLCSAIAYPAQMHSTLVRFLKWMGL
jgi:signal transduction histidine kinase/ligand-binding sensor domain-containing protein